MHEVGLISETLPLISVWKIINFRFLLTGFWDLTWFYEKCVCPDEQEDTAAESRQLSLVAAEADCTSE